MASEGLHEARELLDKVTVDRHRALISLQEELEAIDWYDQRVAATHDPSLAAVLAHNRDEEKEHAAMILEWLRRGDSILDRHLRTYLFTSAEITDIEEEADGSRGDVVATAGAVGDGDDTHRAGTAGSGSLGIGSLKGRE